MMHLRYAIWASLAGVLIPVMAALNARTAKILGEPLHATFVLFAVGVIAAGAASLIFIGRLPSPTALRSVPPTNFVGGCIVGFYIFSVTMLVPRFGVGNAILFVMTAQVFTSAAIDHFGWLGVATRPLNPLRLGGLSLMLVGLWISQLTAYRAAD